MDSFENTYVFNKRMHFMQRLQFCCNNLTQRGLEFYSNCWNLSESVRFYISYILFAADGIE